MHQKLLKSAHYIELGSYQYWPVLVPRGIRLYTYEQIPVFLKDNPYITDGYRAYLPSRLCLKSLFILSNETVNIWSHLLGFFLFFTLGIYDMTSVLPSASASREDFVICSICLFCFQVCMLCSVGYHLFCCHRSEKTSRRWMALDYAGISIGILGCYVSGVFYAFYCNNVSFTYITLCAFYAINSRPLTPLLYLRYIDDIFIIWTHGKETLEEFHHDFNSFHPTINLSLDQSTREVHFLDTTVQLSDGHINNTLYRKPTDRYAYLHASSFHPGHTTRSIVYSQALRYNRICSNPSDRD
uniref:Progestin and adipoQ receptor family member 3 n=1 Tax=Chelydra serpentina TaxID=8475 RepID=A0A8C3SHY8_CHESE